MGGGQTVSGTLAFGMDPHFVSLRQFLTERLYLDPREKTGETRLTPAVAPGTKIEFRGVIESFSNPPYLLTLRLGSGDLVIK